ncbi:Translocation and assembly module subunit TamB [Burkholderiales bacterium]|nr:Translocation and assembly module subunit TamB [Burkholderiales bacterium]
MVGAPDRRDATRRPAWRRAVRAAWLATLAAAIALVALAGATIAFLGTQSALDLAVREVIARSDGRLDIDDARGSLLSTVRVARIAWNGPEAQAEAHDVALDWSPFALLQRRISIRGLGAQTVVIAIKGSDAATEPPAALVLPFPVTIGRVAVGRLDWVLGPRSGNVRGLAFGYTGGAAEHALVDLALAADRGRLAGNVTLAATRPFALAGTVAFAGDADLAGIDAQASIGGTLDSVTLDATGRARGASARARATLAPFAQQPLVSAIVDLADARLAAIDPRWPETSITARVTAVPTPGGYAGTVDATNRAPGTIDANRLPLAALRARFAADGATLALDDLHATLEGGGTARGRVVLVPAGRSVSGTLDVADLDLARVHSRLSPTRLAGTLVADLDEQAQRVRGDLADRTRGIAAAFDATLAGGRVRIASLRAVAGNARLDGSGSIALDGTLAFDADATLARFDPSRFGDFPEGSLDGRVIASGALASPWRASVDVALAGGSQWSGIALAGTARGSVSATEARDVAVDARVAGGRVIAKGDAGRLGDSLAFDLDLPRLEALSPLAAWLPAPLEGRLVAKGTAMLAPRDVGIEARLRGERLRAGPDFAAARLDLRIAWPQRAGAELDRRPVELDVDARDVEAAGMRLASATGTARGTLADHRADVRARVAGSDVEATLAGAFDVGAQRWRGNVTALRSSGAANARLEGPAALEVGRGRIALMHARLRFADGDFRVDDLAIEQGRVTTHGAFTGVPAAAFARIAGVALPFSTDVALGGAWSITASPRLDGTLAIHRERGDVRIDTLADSARDGTSIGLTRLELDVRFADDAVDGQARLASALGGSATLAFALARSPTAAPGTLAPDAPLDATLVGEWPSLALLQPWLGTTATADGRLRADLAARGTLASPVLSGTITGSGLRLDAPQWGMHFAQGTFAARLDDGAVTLDELAFRAGEGTFRASGTLARARRAGDPEGLGTSIAWRADRLRLFNRPDLRLIASGEGTLALADGRANVAGAVRIDEGHVEYERSRGTALATDVVVKGRPAPATPARDARLGGPLTLALDVDLGNRLSFVGEGLEAQLRGRLSLATAPNGRLEARGAISAVDGTYFAYGQRLDLDRDRARLVFDGPLDNPALDIVAMRRNTAVEAGIEITGSVNVPRVTLVSNPPVSDGEKLAWLITGQGLERSTGADLAAISAASASLLGAGGRPFGTSIARRLGLDDLSIRSRTTLDASGAAVANPVVAFGKRLSERLSLVYEQGITVATNTLRLEYALTRSITLRAEAGTASGVGIAYRRSYD